MIEIRERPEHFAAEIVDRAEDLVSANPQAQQGFRHALAKHAVVCVRMRRVLDKTSVSRVCRGAGGYTRWERALVVVGIHGAKAREAQLQVGSQQIVCRPHIEKAGVPAAAARQLTRDKDRGRGWLFGVGVVAVKRLEQTGPLVVQAAERHSAQFLAQLVSHHKTRVDHLSITVVAHHGPSWLRPIGSLIGPIPDEEGEWHDSTWFNTGTKDAANKTDVENLGLAAMWVERTTRERAIGAANVTAEAA